MSDDVAAALHELALEVRALRDGVEMLAERGRLSRDERAFLATLLPAAARVVGTTAFACVDVFDIPALATLLDGHTPSALSWLLGRAAGSRIAGIRVERVGRDRSGALWMLRPEREVAAPPRNGVR